LRSNEGETVLTIPPAARVAAVRAKPRIAIEPTRTEQVQVAVRILYGFVHDNDPAKTHRFDFLIRELLADKAGDFGVRFGQLQLVGFHADIPCNAALIQEEFSFQNRYLVNSALLGRLVVL